MCVRRSKALQIHVRYELYVNQTVKLNETQHLGDND